MKGPIVQRLTKNGWELFLDTFFVTLYRKRDWLCSVPYSESIEPIFLRVIMEPVGAPVTRIKQNHE